jgi:hypothetical protein
MNRRPAAEDGYTGTLIAVLILVILFSLIMYTSFISLGFASGRTAAAGMTRIMDNPVPDGDVIGYADLSGTLGLAVVENLRPSPSELGAVQLRLKLSSVRMMWEQGTGADLGNATVTFTSPTGTKTLPKSTRPVLQKPGWKIVQKGSTLPGQTANSNELLEPNEVFVLFVYPSAPLPRNTPFTIRITIPDQNPVTIIRMVPDPVTPVMDLG